MASFEMTFKESNTEFKAEFGQLQRTSTSDYNDLLNLPSIEGNVLKGDKTFIQLGLNEITPQEIDDMFDELIYGGS